MSDKAASHTASNMGLYKIRMEFIPSFFFSQVIRTDDDIHYLSSVQFHRQDALNFLSLSRSFLRQGWKAKRTRRHSLLLSENTA